MPARFATSSKAIGSGSTTLAEYSHLLSATAEASAIRQERKKDLPRIGFLRNSTSTLLRAKGLDGIDGGGAPRGEIACQRGCPSQADRYTDVRNRVGRADDEQARRHASRQRESGDEPQRQAHGRKPESVAYEHARELGLLRS